MKLAPIEDVIAAIKRGEMIILVDDEDRENEGDLVMAAECVDAQSIAFMATKGCGLVCVSMEGSMLDRLGLPLMTRDSRAHLSTAFTLSIDGSDPSITTGISASDRAATIQAAIADAAGPEDIVSPGHVFPLRARDGGVLIRAGHSEASVDLARLAGFKPAGVIVEIMKPDGEMARLPDLIPYAKEHGLLLASIADLIEYREKHENIIELAAEGTVPSQYGELRAFVYRNCLSDEHHLALVLGDCVEPGVVQEDPVMVRVQQVSTLGGLLPKSGVSSAGVATHSLEEISKNGSGVLVCMRDIQGSRMIAEIESLGGTVHHRTAGTGLQMDPRQYGVGAQILRQLGVRKMRLLSRSRTPLTALAGHGLEVVEFIGLE